MSVITWTSSKLRAAILGPGYLCLLAAVTGCSGSDASTTTPDSNVGGSGTGGSPASSLGGATSVGGAATSGGNANTAGRPGTGGVTTTDTSSPMGGQVATGGAASAGGATTTGGSKATIGTTSTGGNMNAGGALTTGGSTATGGGKATAGATAAGGGISTGGTTATGGVANTGGNKAAGGATSAGGTATAGTKATGGAATGGAATGGTKATGGAATGGTKATGGAATGGAATGGSKATGGTTSTSTCGTHTGFWVDGRVLRDKCCEKVVLRGVNEMVVWSGNQDGTPYFAEIARTGANVVRIAWSASNSSVAKLESAIKNAIANQLIPMPECHDATGDFSKLQGCVNYWTGSSVATVLKTYQDKLLLNIANEVGGTVTQATFTSNYQTAITQLRNAGIHTPLVIDGPQWGQDIDMLQAAGPGLITYDPDHNLLFSVHMWWNDPNGTRVTNELNQSVNMNLPLIVGEFAQHAVTNCSASPFAYKTLLSLSRSLEVGWLAWSWGGVKNSDCASDGPFDMTSNGTYAGLTGWGLDVARTDANSIQNTAVRPRYMTAGTCN